VHRRVRALADSVTRAFCQWGLQPAPNHPGAAARRRHRLFARFQPRLAAVEAAAEQGAQAWQVAAGQSARENSLPAHAASPTVRLSRTLLHAKVFDSECVNDCEPLEARGTLPYRPPCAGPALRLTAGADTLRCASPAPWSRGAPSLEGPPSSPRIPGGALSPSPPPRLKCILPPLGETGDAMRRRRQPDASPAPPDGQRGVVAGAAGRQVATVDTARTVWAPGRRLDLFVCLYLVFGCQLGVVLATLPGKLAVLAGFGAAAHRLLTFRRWRDETEHAKHFFKAFVLLVLWLGFENCMIWCAWVVELAPALCSDARFSALTTGR
jgi:hypothetical protein